MEGSSESQRLSAKGAAEPQRCGIALLRNRISQVIYKLTVVSTITLFVLSILSLFGNHLFIELTTHFRLQYILLGVLCALLLAGFRSWKLLPLVLLVVVLNSLYVQSYYFSPRTHQLANPQVAVRLVQVNLLYTNTNSDRAISAIQAAAADVVVLQELSDDWRQQLQTLNQLYPYSEWQPRPRGSGMAVLSRFPLKETRVLELDAGASRPAILTRVAVGSGSLTLLSLHPTTPVTPKRFTHRNLQFREAAAILANVNEPKILIGDLNATMWSPYFSQLLQEAGLRDARLGFGLQATWPAPLPGLFRIAIDHCLVSDQVQVENVRVGASTGSDHYPLIVDLKL